MKRGQLPSPLLRSHRDITMTVLKRSIGLVAAAIVLSSTTFALPHTLLIRQVAAASNSSDSNSINNGGAGSAQISAQAAGSSISTGTGGDRSTPSSPEEFAQLLSGIFFGALLTLFVGGALAVQVWHYYESFGRRGADKVRIQVTVGVVVLLSLFQDCALVHRIFSIHVLHFGDFAFPLLTVGWEIASSFVCISIMNGLVQMYYAHRVWVAFQKSRYFLIIYTILIAFSFAGGVASAALIIQSGSAANVKGEALRSFLPDSIPWQFSVVFASWLCSSCFIDVSLCTCLIYQLSKMSTPFFHTRHAVARMLLLSLETCAATSALSFVSMVLFLSIPYQSYYNITFLPIGQVAASSLLVTIMARPGIARDLAHEQTIHTSLPRREGGSAPPASPTTQVRPTLVQRWMNRDPKKRTHGDGTGVHLTTIIQQQRSTIEGDEQETPWYPLKRSDSPTMGMMETHAGSSSTVSSSASRSGVAKLMPCPSTSPTSLVLEKPLHSYDRMHPSTAAYFGCSTENGTESIETVFGRTPRGRIVSVLPPPRDVNSPACPWSEPVPACSTVM